MYVDLIGCALTKEDNYCIINYSSHLGLTIRNYVARKSSRRRSFIAMQLMSWNILAKPRTIIYGFASTFITPAELNSRS